MFRKIVFGVETNSCEHYRAGYLVCPHHRPSYSFYQHDRPGCDPGDEALIAMSGRAGALSQLWAPPGFEPRSVAQKLSPYPQRRQSVRRVTGAFWELFAAELATPPKLNIRFYGPSTGSQPSSMPGAGGVVAQFSAIAPLSSLWASHRLRRSLRSWKYSNHYGFWPSVRTRGALGRCRPLMERPCLRHGPTLLKSLQAHGAMDNRQQKQEHLLTAGGAPPSYSKKWTL